MLNSIIQNVNSEKRKKMLPWLNSKFAHIINTDQSEHAIANFAQFLIFYF